ncbi:MAG: CotH kinase family protein [Verrucomicrobia bacterium]|nr:CotH kinase family protein [Verrucomicrobiota bacterium]
MLSTFRSLAVAGATLFAEHLIGAAPADTLVAYWPFERNTADAAQSGSVSDNGTWVGATTYGSGRFGEGIKLDGSNYISVLSSPDVDRAGGDISISGWFTVDRWDKSWQCLVAKGEGDRWRVHRSSASGTQLAYAGGVADISGGSVNDKNWHHVVAVSEAGVATHLYIDGVQVASGGGPGIGASAGPVLIGENPDAKGRQWVGSIDDLGIFSSPLNEHQAKAIHDLGVNPRYQYTLAQVNGLIITHARGLGSVVNVRDSNWQYVDANPADGSFFVRLGVDGSGMAGSTGPPIRSFAASETVLSLGESLTLNWEVGTDAATLTITPEVGSVLPLTTGGVGRIALNPGPSVDTIYTITAANGNGANTRDLRVEVTDQPIIDFFTASQTVVEPNAVVTLTWKARNTVSLDLNGRDVIGTTRFVVTAADTITYRLTARNANGMTIEEIPITVVIPGEPIISEFMAENTGTLLDEDGESADWIELRNPTATASILNDYYLTDDPDGLMKWKIPFAVINPGQTLLVFASGKDRSLLGREMHTNFSLRASGEYLALVKIASGRPLILSEFSDYPRQFEDISFGVAPDGVTLGYLERPTPNAANGIGLVDFVRDTTFFPDRGFYETPILVEISSSTPGASFRYTLNGTIPSPTSGILYTGPIFVSTTTTLRAVGYKANYLPTSVDSQTYIFLNDVIRQPSNPPGFPSSWAGQRADYQMDPDVVDNPAYRDTIKDDLKAIPTISIAMRADDLFGSGGIYSNPNGEGINWERAGSMELIYPDGSKGHQANCGVRMQGGVGRNPGFLKHSFRLLFKRDYGSTKLDYPLFNLASEDAKGATDRFDTITLRAGFNNAWHRANASEERRAQFLRDQFMHDSQLAMGHASPHGIFVHLYLNGLYWGVYNVVERPNADFASSYYGGRKEEWDALNSYPRNVVDGTATAWQTAQRVALGGVSNQAGYDNLTQYVDMDNLIDYMLLNFYGGNLDWDDHNWYAARHRVPGAGYKFFSWDAERVLENITGDNRTGIGQNDKPSRFFERLKQNAEFRMRFADHAHKHLFNGGALSPLQSAARYRKLANVIDRAIVGESARWGDSQRSVPYTRNTEWVTERDRLLNQYFPARTDAVLGHLRGHNPRLYPSVDAPVFSQHGGHVSSRGELTLTASRGLIYYTKDGSDPRLPGGAVNPGAIPYDGAVSSATLVAAGSNWRFLDDGSDQGAAWRNPGFNDANWRSGPAELGYGDGGEATVVSFGPDSGNKRITTYFRHYFNTTNPSEFTALTLEILRDDGFVAYLNGNLLKADNMPGGTITYQTPSAGTVGGADESAFFSFAVPVTGLREGANVVAVEIHQISGSSSDISFDLRLTAARPNAVNPLFMTNTGLLKARAFDGGEWSALNEALFIVDAVAAGKANLAITEINYRPLPPTPQEEEAGLNARSDFEFIELANIGSADVDVTNVRFIKGIEFNFNDSPLGFILPAGKRVLIVNNRTGFTTRYPLVPTSMIAGEFSGNLSDDGERILLLASDDSILIDFTYNDKAPWPEAADGDGMTLNLIDPANRPDLTRPLNWRASVVVGGTPGGTDATRFSGVPNEDRDLDTLSALAEYGFGSSDTDSGDAPFPIGVIGMFDTGSGPEEYLTFSYVRNLAADDVSYTVQISEDLANWRSGAGQVVYVRSIHNGDGTEIVTYRSEFPLGRVPEEYMRVAMALK